MEKEPIIMQMDPFMMGTGLIIKLKELALIPGKMVKFTKANGKMET